MPVSFILEKCSKQDGEMKKIVNILLAFILAFAGILGLMSLFPQIAAAATLIVTTNSDTGDDFTIGADLTTDISDGSGLSLREALNWAGAGDTVTFDGGMSGQTVTLNGTQLTIDKDIILDGDLDDDGIPDITIDGNNTSRVIYANGLTAAARLEGLTICDGTTADNGGGMYNSNSSPTITNCTFSNNTASWPSDGGGMYNSNSSPTITNCGFFDNIAGDIGGGMANANSSPTITNCTFAGNWAQYSSIFGDPLSGITITNCIIWGNTGGGAGCFGGIDATAGTVTYSNVHLFAGCVEVPGTYPGTGNIQQDALFVDAAGGDYHLQSQSGHWISTGWVTDAQTSPCIDAGNPLSTCGNEPSPNGGRINMGAYGNTAQASKSLPATLTVTTNSDTGDNTTFGVSLGADEADGSGLSIREALNWASAGDTVTFDGGMSGQTVTLNGTQLTIDKDITLDGDLDDDSTPDITISGNNTSGVIATVGLTTAARLEGLTITNGVFTGGMFNNSSSPTIINCTFSGNSASNNGGGMYNVFSSPTITNCTFSGNTAGDFGGGMYNTQSSPTISDCTFSSNSAVGGSGIYNIISSPVITGCIFSDNSASNFGGGINNEASSPTITSCIFSGNSAGSNGGGMGNVSNSSPTITSCTFSGNTASRSGGGMLNSESTPTITGCNFTANTADGGGINDAQGGGMYNYKSTLTIAGCTFLDNTATATGAWVSLGGGISNVESSLTITNGTFSGNTAEAGGGMYNAPSSPDITNCTFSGNSATYGGGIYNIGASSPTITNCILWGDTDSEIYNDTNPPVPSPVVTYCDVQGGFTGTGNIDADPLFVNAAGGDFHLKSEAGHWTSTGWVTDTQTSPCIDTGDPDSACGNEPSPNGGHINMGAYGNTAQASKSLPTTLTVTTNSDAGDDFTSGANLAADMGDGSGLSLREAINWAGTGDTVTFDGGMSGQTVTLNGTQLAVNEDITLDGDLDNDGTPDITISGNNTSRVFHGTELTASARLEGLTIKNGNAAGGLGGGMYIDDCDPTIINCTFSSNSANDGGGIYMDGVCNPTITNCLFTGDTASSFGGAIFLLWGNLEITNCRFTSNSASVAGGAIIMFWGGSPVITNCLFAGNTSAAGGAIWIVQDTWPVITNSTFTGNSDTSSNHGDAIGQGMPGGLLTINNCILWGDTGSGWEITAAPVSVTYSNVQGGYTGTGNIDADPLFVNAAGSDFHLQATSPCIDTGSNADVPGGITVDFEGDARIIDGDGDSNAVVDMGADETDYPVITSFTPTPASTGTSVTVTGIRFTGATAVKFGGTDAASFTVDSDTQITAIVGSGSTGKVTVIAPGGTATSTGDFTFDNTPPIGPTNVQSTGHTIGTWSANNIIDVIWTDATDAESGLDGYAILWDTSATTIPDAVKDIEEGVQATTSPVLADGNSHYFHIRSVDNVGNWQSAIHLGPFFIDTTPGDITPPTAPGNVQSTSHIAGWWSDDNTIDVTWTDATDAGSGLDGYSILWDTSAATVPAAIKNIEEGVQATTSPVLFDGYSHYFHIRSVDNAGNWQSAVHLGPFFIDTTPTEPAEEPTSPTGPAPARPAPVPATAGDAFVSDNVSTTGVFTQTVTAPSADGKVRVIIEEGVRGLSAEGKRLSWITVRPAFYTPSPPAGAHIIGLCYRFQPSGATFSPPITITYTYDDSEIPAGIAEEDLVIALYDEENGKWVEYKSTVDPVTNTITIQVSHFSVYGILTYGIAPIGESAAPIQESSAPTPESANWGLIGGITGACIVVIVALFVVLGRRRLHRHIE
jgi:predicted outer membrane repeat protein